ncbi:MAG: glycoside hydrolase family 2 TIM barrel-domain containing protein [Pirellulales bacterium]
MAKHCFSLRCTFFRALLFAVVSGQLLITAAPSWAQAQVAATVFPVVENFSRDWRFTKGDPTGAEAASFNDSAWQPVRLPHDWAITGPHQPDEWGHTGKLPWRGVGWYRKTFTLDPAWAGKEVYLDFDGVMAFPRVYVNGQLAGEWDYGYTSFRVDATKFVKFGQPNTVAVRVDTTNHGSRWYPGAGIYRKVSLVVANPIHIAQWGIYVTTPEIHKDSATVRVRTAVQNSLDAKSNVSVAVVVRDPQGKEVASGSTSDILEPMQPHWFGEKLKVAAPQLWDIESPKLYTAEVTVRSGDRIVDRQTTTFGIRTAEFTANDGFHLNGKRVQLHGVCLHHDHGPLGAAFFPRAMERQLEIMRDMGVNAIRTSHNAPAPELLALCDKMGFVVWDECFDKWDDKADRVNGQPSLEDHAQRHLRALVARDRNHPSVVVWSIANEIGDMGGANGLTKDRVAMMRDVVRSFDDTRPVGLAHHIPETAYSDILEPLDVTGWNYARRYAVARERFPDKPILYSESASALSTRGFYELPLVTARTDYSDQHQVDSYDLNSARWSDIADVEFDLMERDKFVAGEFVWTGFDYLGEPTPFDRQAASSYFGIVDTCGIPKDRYYLYRSYWRPDTETVHILPHWNWPDRVGQNVPVFVYTSGDSAELFLNGKSLGRREKLKSYSPPVNIAVGKPATASSVGTRGGKPQTPNQGNDGDGGTTWVASTSEKGEWWQIDLGGVEPVADVLLSTEGNPGNFLYRIDVSDDGSQWRTVVDHDKWHEGWGDQFTHGINTDARYIRVTFTDLKNDVKAAVRDFAVYPQSYYAVADKYRLRWNEVPYEPGELKAVAYKDGKQIGETVMKTAGAPAALRLTPDRKQIAATGDDLCYVLVEAVDADGNLAPLADNLIEFEVSGPATIAGVGNGDPLSLEDYQSNQRKLFFGKALLILRSDEGPGGTIKVSATSSGLSPGSISVESR